MAAAFLLYYHAPLPDLPADFSLARARALSLSPPLPLPLLLQLIEARPMEEYTAEVPPGGTLHSAARGDGGTRGLLF